MLLLFILFILLFIAVLFTVGWIVLNLYFKEQIPIALILILVFCISGIIYLYSNQLDIAYKNNQYIEKVYYIEAVIGDRVIHSEGELKITDHTLPNGLKTEVLGVENIKDIKYGDIIKIKFLQGITVNRSVKIEVVGHFERKN